MLFLFRKRLVQEVKPSQGTKNKKSTCSEFEQNLKKKYSKNCEKQEENPVKIFEEHPKQLNAVSSKRLLPKRPLFGRAFCPQTEEVRLKFLLNGVENIKDVFFYLPEEVSKYFQNVMLGCSKLHILMQNIF